MEQTKFQIGKNGITPGVIESLHLAFKKHKLVRISALKSTGRDKQKIKEMAEELAQKLKTKTHHFTYGIIGFTILLRRRVN